MIKNLLKNCRKPQGIGGKLILSAMNRGHAPLCDWVLNTVSWTDGAKVLDIGCGGGANIDRMFQKYPSCHIDGIDYSAESVKVSKKTNATRLNISCEILQGNVMKLPYPNHTYDVATAIETVYFWPDVTEGFRHIFRVLKPGGKVIVACEMSDPVRGDKWAKRCEGMTIYTAKQLQEMLEQAGFENIQIHTIKEVCSCLEAIKPL